ncbi:MAG: hypothetical protein Q7S09_02485 [bacterium]|nr:hypothetical protein [bacterium]
MSLRAIVYILTVLFRKIGRFFLHWYTNGSRIYWHSVLDFFAELERMISLRITAANWYKPLYGDDTRFGTIVGIPIRLGRMFLSVILYAFLLTFFATAYGLYLAIPIFLLSRLV